VFYFVRIIQLIQAIVSQHVVILRIAVLVGQQREQFAVLLIIVKAPLIALAFA
jgi:hypothetical protein